MIGTCTNCGKHTYVMPLHGEKGGPLFCPFCGGHGTANTARR